MQAGSSCPGSQELEAIVKGPASSWDVERLARHLEECPHCGEVVDELLDAETVLGTLRVARAEPESAEADTVASLVARVRELGYGVPNQNWDRDLAMLSRGLDPDGPTATPKSAAPDCRGEEDWLGLLEPPQEPGELGRLGPYGITRLLGTGGMGVVLEARQTHPRRLVALKMILAGPGSGRQWLARFHSETEVIARLQHPNIVQIYEVGEYRGRPYFTMEYINGGSLAQRLAGSPLPAREAAELLKVLALAVQHAHERGFVHRDLKPANVLLQVADSSWQVDGRGGAVPARPALRPPHSARPKITDFGLAKQLDEEADGLARIYRTETGIILGTPAYMAPEQAVGQGRRIGPATDVYALGVMLYEALTGRPPFKAAGVLETLEQVHTQEPLPPARLQPDVPRDLQTVCLKCLEKEPGRRYASARDLAKDLERFLAGEPIRARPVSAGERLRKWVRRKPALAALLAVSCLSLVTLAVGGLVYSARLRDALHRKEASYQAARETLSRMLRRLEDPGLAEVPRLKELQKDLLEDARLFYQDHLAAQDNPEPALRLDAAVSLEQAGTLQEMLGRHERAAEYLRTAVQLLDGLPAALREEPEQQGRLAHCYTELGAVSDRPDETEQWNQKALHICERVARARPDDANWQNRLAQSHHNLGTMYQLRNRFTEAETHTTRAREIRGLLVRNHPQHVVYRAELAETYQNLGLAQASLRRLEEAGSSFAEAERLLEPLLRAQPEIQIWALSLASTYINWGNLLQQTGRSQEALARHARAIDLAEAVLRKEPQYQRARHFALMAHGARAWVLESLGRHAEAVRDWDGVVALDAAAERPRHRALRAAALARAGEHARPVAEAQVLAGEPVVSDELLYDLACVYALAGKAAQGDAQLPRHQRAARAEHCAVQAVSLLQKLQGHQFFRLADHFNLLKEDRDLSSLWARVDFQKLVPK